MVNATLASDLTASPEATVSCIDRNGQSYVASNFEFDDGTTFESEAGTKVCIEWLGGEWKVVAAECP